MITLAITGGVATGKSAAVGKLGEMWGDTAAFFSADASVHELLTTSRIKTKLSEVFGNAIFDAAGEVDRGKLRQIVFRDPLLRRKLEQIIHPEVFEAGKEAHAFAKESRSLLFVYEIPLLYEVESQRERDFDVVVAASEETQRLRMAEKRGLEPEIIDNLLKAQMPIDEKVRRADFVIWNDGSEAELEEQVFLLSNLLQSAPARDEFSPVTAA